jgi:hypothetical protein
VLVDASGARRAASNDASTDLEVLAGGVDEALERVEGRIAPAMLIGRYDRLRRPGSAGELSLGQTSAPADVVKQLPRVHGGEYIVSSIDMSHDLPLSHDAMRREVKGYGSVHTIRRRRDRSHRCRATRSA